jgi:uncharacterized protein (TIGR01244 family)
MALDAARGWQYHFGMQINALTPTYAVAPQITPEDVAQMGAQGITTVICNRPDMENPMELHADVLRAAVEAAGLQFHDNPLMGGGLSLDHVETQARLIADSPGGVLAYCASGTRSAILWALAMAGELPTDEILGAAAQAGYDLSGMRGQIDPLAARR